MDSFVSHIVTSLHLRILLSGGLCSSQPTHPTTLAPSFPLPVSLAAVMQKKYNKASKMTFRKSIFMCLNHSCKVVRFSIKSPSSFKGKENLQGPCVAVCLSFLGLSVINGVLKSFSVAAQPQVTI